MNEYKRSFNNNNNIEQHQLIINEYMNELDNWHKFIILINNALR